MVSITSLLAAGGVIFFFFLCMTITSEKLASQADQASLEKWSVYKNDDSD